MAIALPPDSQQPFFDTLALLEWRHSTDVLQAVRKAKRGQCEIAPAEVTWAQCDFDFLASMGDQIDLFASSATDTLIVGAKWNQFASVDSYLDLFQSAAQGKVLNTQFQFQTFLNFLGINATPYVGTRTNILGDVKRPAIMDGGFYISDGGHQYFALLPSIQDFWIEISDALEGNESIKSPLDVLKIVGENLRPKVRVKILHLILLPLLASKLAPSTRDWVHEFVLWTGISPPAEASETDAMGVCNAQRPNTEEDYRDFLFRQQDCPDRARRRRTRRSERSRKTGCSTNRHFVSSRNAGRGAFRRSWANCQDASHQAA